MQYLGVRKRGVEEAPLQDELMLFEPESARFFVLNPTMAIVWRSCDGETILDGAADLLMQEFSGVDRERAIEDLTYARNQLVELGLVELK